MNYRFQPKLLPTIVTLLLLPLLISLGFWQLDRAAQKRDLQNQYFQRGRTEINLSTLDNNNTTNQDFRFYRLTVLGEYDNQHNILIDNKIYHHQIGYELITPFYIFDSSKIILIDRGWIAADPNRNILPKIDPIIGEQSIRGILLAVNQNNFQLGDADQFSGQWPWRVQNIDLSQLNKLLGTSVYSYMLLHNDQEWSPYNTNSPPMRHIAYAVQWFALALTLFIIYIVVNIRRKDN